MRLIFDGMITQAPSVQQTLADRLAAQQRQGLLRQLQTTDDRIDFCSNDYLGLARSPELRTAVHQADSLQTKIRNGATGSRLLAGQTQLASQLEKELAQFYKAESALVFNSGYDANLGLLASLPRAGDTLLTDELIHASMIDGARLSYATRHRFRHNDLADLTIKLQQAIDERPNGQLFVAVESIYSMDGDAAPLIGLAALCRQYGAALIVDEAHATGLYGSKGEGLVVELGLQEQVFARVHTFGKAVGVHGAAVAGSAVLRSYLINFARSFVYTTALPPHSLIAIQCAHTFVKLASQARIQLRDRIAYFKQQANLLRPDSRWTASQSPIQCLLVTGNEAARYVATQAQRAGFDVRAILSPTVPVGEERLRICIHSFNTVEEIDHLLVVLHQALISELAV